jgi:hypothetical protein
MKINCGKCKREIPEDTEDFECGHMFCAMANSVLLFGGLMGRRRKRNRWNRMGENTLAILDNDRITLIEEPPSDEEEEEDGKAPDIIEELCEEDNKKPDYTTSPFLTEYEQQFWNGYI